MKVRTPETAFVVTGKPRECIIGSIKYDTSEEIKFTGYRQIAASRKPTHCVSLSPGERTAEERLRCCRRDDVSATDSY